MRLKTSYNSVHQNTFCIYWYLIKLQNVMINRIHFNTFLGELTSGSNRKCIFLFTGRWAYNGVGLLSGGTSKRGLTAANWFASGHLRFLILMRSFRLLVSVLICGPQ